MTEQLVHEKRAQPISKILVELFFFPRLYTIETWAAVKLLVPSVSFSSTV